MSARRTLAPSASTGDCSDLAKYHCFVPSWDHSPSWACCAGLLPAPLALAIAPALDAPAGHVELQYGVGLNYSAYKYTRYNRFNATEPPVLKIAPATYANLALAYYGGLCINVCKEY